MQFMGEYTAYTALRWAEGQKQTAFLWMDAFYCIYNRYNI